MLVMPRPLLSNAQLQTGNTLAIGVLAEHVPRSVVSARMEDILASSRVHALMRQLLQWKRSIFSNPPFGAAVLLVKPRNRVHVLPVQVMGIRDRCGTGADPWMPGTPACRRSRNCQRVRLAPNLSHSQPGMLGRRARA